MLWLPQDLTRSLFIDADRAPLPEPEEAQVGAAVCGQERAALFGWADFLAPECFFAAIVIRLLALRGAESAPECVNADRGVSRSGPSKRNARATSPEPQ